MSMEQKIDQILGMLDTVAVNTMKALQASEAAKEMAGAARDEARAARDMAGAARDEARAARDEARAARDMAEAARDEARAAREIAGAARDEAKAAREIAGAARDEARAARILGEANQKNIQLLAEGQGALNDKVDRFINMHESREADHSRHHLEIGAKYRGIEDRITRLEQRVNG